MTLFPVKELLPELPLLESIIVFIFSMIVLLLAFIDSNSSIFLLTNAYTLLAYHNF